MTTLIPKVVVIQERHVRNGENFKIIQVNNNVIREYISKFLSQKKLTFRYQYKKVTIGQRVKEITYKGSPLATSRILFLDILSEPFPTFNNQEDNQDPPLSFFNLTDLTKQENLPNNKSSSKIKNILIRPSYFDSINAEPSTMSDFYLLFGIEFMQVEDNDSGDDTEPPLTIDEEVQPKRKKLSEIKEKKSLNNSIKKIENDVNQIALKIQAAFDTSNRGVISGTFQNIPPMVSSPSTSRWKQDSSNCNYQECTCLNRSGSVPFFRVYGGCLLAVQTSNQTTAVLHATFITGSDYYLQYQQVQLPICEPMQTVSIHLSPHRLHKEEINQIFHFIRTTNVFDKQSNLGRF